MQAHARLQAPAKMTMGGCTAYLGEGKSDAHPMTLRPLQRPAARSFVYLSVVPLSNFYCGKRRIGKHNQYLLGTFSSHSQLELLTRVMSVGRDKLSSIPRWRRGEARRRKDGAEKDRKGVCLVTVL